MVKVCDYLGQIYVIVFGEFVKYLLESVFYVDVGNYVINVQGVGFVYLEIWVGVNEQFVYDSFLVVVGLGRYLVFDQVICLVV